MSELLEHHESHRPSGKHVPRPAPLSWSVYRSRIRYRWATPLLFVDWLSQWAAYGLRKLSILELLETCSSFTLLIGLIFYFAEAPERTKTKHYQAWQVINTAQGKGGSGGRIDALHELNEDGVPLVGVDVSDSFLQGVKLERANLRRGNFRAADLRGADLRGAELAQSTMRSANLRGSRLDGANLTDADLFDADLTDAVLAKCRLGGVSFERADLRGVDLAGTIDWKGVRSFTLADIHGIRNAPNGFITWAMSNGALDIASDSDWAAAISRATSAGKK